jgi:hypothetical protein
VSYWEPHEPKKISRFEWWAQWIFGIAGTVVLWFVLLYRW